MRVDPQITIQLNAVLREMLTLINQTFLHARMLQNWGFNHLGSAEYSASIKAMKLADKLINRILFLEGLPNLQDLGRLRIAEEATEVISCDLALYTQTRDIIVAAIAECESKLDFQSREHLDELLEDCEEMIDFWETQESLVASLGTENYLQSQLGEEESH